VVKEANYARDHGEERFGRPQRHQHGPWATDDLVGFIATLLVDLPFTNIVIENHRPQPGVKREKQKIIKLSTKWNDKSLLTIGILSPKRAATRSDLLDRLSLADDLKPHETSLPERALAILQHALRHRVGATTAGSSQWACERGSCDCVLSPLNDG
jgi:hypothetical protein